MEILNIYNNKFFKIKISENLKNIIMKFEFEIQIPKKL